MSEHQPSVGEMIERDSLARELHRPPSGQRRHQRSQPHALGSQGDGGERDPGMTTGHIAEEHVIPEEETIPAYRFRVASQCSEHARIGVRTEFGSDRP